MNFHECAEIYPLMNTVQFARLLSDIEKNGQIDAIELYRGEVLDGRNRYNACLQLAIEPVYLELDDSIDPLQHVISKNERRDLSESVRAMIADSVANLGRGRLESNASRDAFISQSQAADMFGVSRRTVQRAHFVRENAIPEIVEQVEQGDLTVTDGERIARLPKGRQKRYVKRGKNKLKDLAARHRVKKVTAAHRKNNVVELLTNTGIEWTDDDFKLVLLAIRARAAKYSRYIDPILEEMEEMELLPAVREAYDKILSAVDLGLCERRQIKSKTGLDDSLLDGGLAYLVEFGDLIMLDQNKITAQARGQKKVVYRRPETSAEKDPYLKYQCADCDQPVGRGYKKIDIDTVICKTCAEEEGSGLD